MMSDYFILLSS